MMMMMMKQSIGVAYKGHATRPYSVGRYLMLLCTPAVLVCVSWVLTSSADKACIFFRYHRIDIITNILLIFYILLMSSISPPCWPAVFSCVEWFLAIRTSLLYWSCTVLTTEVV